MPDVKMSDAEKSDAEKSGADIPGAKSPDAELWDAVWSSSSFAVQPVMFQAALKTSQPIKAKRACPANRN